MKKTILTMTLLAMFGISGFAQGEGRGKGQGMKKKEERMDMNADQKAKRGAEWAEKKLGLNADQKAKWEAAAKERITANTAVRDKLKGSTTPEERKKLHEEAKANNDKFNNTVAGFLTPEQKTKFDKIKADKREAHKAKMKGKKQEDEKDIEPEVED